MPYLKPKASSMLFFHTIMIKINVTIIITSTTEMTTAVTIAKLGGVEDDVDSVSSFG